MSSRRDSEELFTITELARKLALTPRAIRFYEDKGLLTPRRAGTRRVYTHKDRGRLMIILRGKHLGFSIASIKEYLDLYDADPAHREQAQRLLVGVRAKVDQLERQRQDLDLTLDELSEIEQQTLKFLDGREAESSKGG
ncbi:MAG: MerR family DNA-binding transcriptional regulator [Acidobacteriota bacterium]|nr:MerR family DNA-binding transcriptional regulator [Acidobacteriota bacterium]